MSVSTEMVDLLILLTELSSLDCSRQGGKLRRVRDSLVSVSASPIPLPSSGRLAPALPHTIYS